MHEANYTQEIVSAILEALKAHPGASPKQVVVRVGEMLHLVPESVQAHYAQMTRSTELEKVVLRLEEVPVEVQCRDCGATGGVEDHHFLYCSACGSLKVGLVKGDEVTIESIELERASEGGAK